MIVQVGLVQKSGASPPARNMEIIEGYLRQAARLGLQLVVLPELHNGPYFCQSQDPAYFDWAESIPGPTTLQLAAWAKQYQLVIVGSLFERRLPGLYHNTAVVLDRDGRLAGTYRKMHIPDDPGFYEKYYFTPGDQGFQCIDTSLGRLGVMVCWDQWFPEAARIMALSGAQILIYPTAIGWDPRDDDTEQQRQLQAWITIQRAHAIANGLPVLVCNRVGLEPHPQDTNPGTQFWGHSFMSDAFGKVMAIGDSEQSGLIHATVDLAECEKIRQIWPFLRDRRIDAYQPLLQRAVIPPDKTH